MFGERTAIQINSSNMVRYQVIVKAVSFGDGSFWHTDKKEALSLLPAAKKRELSGELLEQLKRDLKQQNIPNAISYQPQRAMGLWQCGCGFWQPLNTPCRTCGVTEKQILEAGNPAKLAVHLQAYHQEQERLRIEAEKAAEEARIAREKEAEERRLRE